MPLDRDQKRFVGLGQKLCGDEGWQRKFARIIGMSHQLVGQIANGDRIVTENVRAKVHTGLVQEARRLRERLYIVTTYMREYENRNLTP